MDVIGEILSRPVQLWEFLVGLMLVALGRWRPNDRARQRLAQRVDALEKRIGRHPD
ncbi:MAG: hypothetical protein AAF899_11915 [Pseudomonadota bacterium]